jgi:hypothetical protein
MSTRERIPIRQWCRNFYNGKYDAKDVDTQIDAGWYDWFCSDKALAAKTQKLGPKVCKISNSRKVDKDKMYVFFKNNALLAGGLYDDFRICSLASERVVYTVVPSTPVKRREKGISGASEVWGKENSFQGPLVTGTWKDVLDFFGVK